MVSYLIYLLVKPGIVSIGVWRQGCYDNQGSHAVWNFKTGFQDFDKVLNLANICIRY